MTAGVMEWHAFDTSFSCNYTMLFRAADTTKDLLVRRTQVNTTMRPRMSQSLAHQLTQQSIKFSKCSILPNADAEN